MQLLDTRELESYKHYNVKLAAAANLFISCLAFSTVHTLKPAGGYLHANATVKHVTLICDGQQGSCQGCR
jgi:hypothetical protein